MIDEKGKLFGLVNVIDLTVVVVVLAVLAAGVYKFGIEGRAKSEAAAALAQQGEVLVTVKSRSQANEAASLLKPGDKLVAKGAFQTAEIVSVDIQPSAYVAWTDEGESVNTVHPIWKDVVVVIKDKGAPTDPIIKVGGQEARAGKEYILKTQKVELISTVYDIQFN